MREEGEALGEVEQVLFRGEAGEHGREARPKEERYQGENER